MVLVVKNGPGAGLLATEPFSSNFLTRLPIVCSHGAILHL